jgi:hypothetical protein
MATPRDAALSCPEGLEFLTLVRGQEDACEQDTLDRLTKLGKSAPDCMRNLGTVLSLADRMASCFWVCRAGDHVFEYLAGRMASTARAALRLLLFGFYDESLTLTRNIGETANLLFLFSRDEKAFPQWLALDERQRWNNFRPREVLKKLKKLHLPELIDEDRYSKLSAVGTHVTPDTRPQSHNPLGMPVLGAIFQEGGVLVSLNELAIAVSFAFIAVPKLLDYEDERTDEIRNACRELLKSVGGVNILNCERMFATILEQAQGQHRR